MPTFDTRQQSHRAMARRSDPARREPGLLGDILNPVVSNVVDPGASAVVKPVANKVVKPLVTGVVKPVVDPLLAPLTQGASQPASTPPPANTPPPTTTPSGGSSDGSGNGGGGSNGNGGNGGGSNGNGGNGGGSGNGNGNGNNGGDGDGNSGGGGQGSSGGSGDGSSTGGGSENSSGGSTGTGVPTGGSGDSSGGNPAPEDTQGATGIGSDQTATGTAAGTSPSSGSNFLATEGNVPVNAGSDPNAPAPDSNTDDPSKTNSPATGSTAFFPGQSGIGTPGGIGNGNNGGGSGGVHGNGASSSKGGLSKGAVAGIVIAAVFVIGIAIFLIVRRQRKHKNVRRQQWWSSRNGASATYNDGVQPDTFVATRRSVGSSFETTVDHSQAPRLDLGFEVPSLPPMAQLRREPLLINLDSPVTRPQVMVTSHESPDTPSRFSVGTATSSLASSELGQWLVVSSHIASEAGQTSPMSVRPFSPNEAFAFPKPPTESSGSNYSSQAPSRKGTISGLPSLPVPELPSNPFEDPVPAVKVYKVPSPINVAAANPFVDPLPNLPPSPNTPSAVHPEFMELESIKRPFVATLSDEILVEIGDNVKILQMFDDGWSLVEKNPIQTRSVKGKGKPAQVGLIPIDCFRNPGQDVNEFIASKRVSSYSQTSGLY